MSEKHPQRTPYPQRNFLAASALVVVGSVLGVLLVVPEHALAKVKGPKLPINTTSGKHIPEGTITVRNQGAGQQPAEPSSRKSTGQR